MTIYMKNPVVCEAVAWRGNWAAFGAAWARHGVCLSDVPALVYLPAIDVLYFVEAGKVDRSVRRGDYVARRIEGLDRLNLMFRFVVYSKAVFEEHFVATTMRTTQRMAEVIR